MSKRSLLGCGGCGLAVFFVLVALGLVLLMTGSSITGFVKSMVTEAQDRAAWVAPAAGMAGEAMFPATLEGAQRRSVERISEVASVNIQRNGERGSYLFSHSGEAFEIYAWNVTQGEVGGIFDSVGQAIDEGDYKSKMKFTFNQNEMSFSFSPPSTSGRLWFNKGWLFLFLTGDDVNLEPVEASYIRAIEGAGIVNDGLPLLPEAETP